MILSLNLGIYGFPEDHNKRNTWLLVRNLMQESSGKTILFGDFNDVLDAEEKSEGNSRSLSQLGWSRQTLDNCGLVDLGFEGYPFTWSNGRKEENNIQCRLDRAFATSTFINRFSQIKALHLP